MPWCCLRTRQASYSVVDVARSQEKGARYNQTVNVMWGKGQIASLHPAKLLFASIMHVSTLLLL